MADCGCAHPDNSLVDKTKTFSKINKTTGNGRNPMFNGRRQPSCDSTSRIGREAYVRICEGLGAKFPGNSSEGRRSAVPQIPDTKLSCNNRRSVPRTQR